MKCIYCQAELLATSVRNTFDGIVATFFCKKCDCRYRKELENGRICIYDNEGRLINKLFTK